MMTAPMQPSELNKDVEMSSAEFYNANMHESSGSEFSADSNDDYSSEDESAGLNQPQKKFNDVPASISLQSSVPMQQWINPLHQMMPPRPQFPPHMGPSMGPPFGMYTYQPPPRPQMMPWGVQPHLGGPGFVLSQFTPPPAHQQPKPTPQQPPPPAPKITKDAQVQTDPVIIVDSLENLPAKPKRKPVKRKPKVSIKNSNISSESLTAPANPTEQHANVPTSVSPASIMVEHPSVGGKTIPTRVLASAHDDADDEDEEEVDELASDSEHLPRPRLNQGLTPSEYVERAFPHTPKPDKTKKSGKVPTVKGDLRMGYWTDGESQRLLDAVEKHGKDWAKVVEYVGARSKVQCEKRWRRFVQRPDPKFRLPPSLLAASNAYTAQFTSTEVLPLKRGQRDIVSEVVAGDVSKEWTSKDNLKLILAVKKLGDTDWEAISKEIEGQFTSEECKIRWRELEAKYNVDSSDESGDEIAEESPRKKMKNEKESAPPPLKVTINPQSTTQLNLHPPPIPKVRLIVSPTNGNLASSPRSSLTAGSSNIIKALKNPTSETSSTLSSISSDTDSNSDKQKMTEIRQREISDDDLSTVSSISDSDDSRPIEQSSATRQLSASPRAPGRQSSTEPATLTQSIIAPIASTLSRVLASTASTIQMSNPNTDSSSSTSPFQKPQRKKQTPSQNWTPEEDEVLIKTVQKYGNIWQKVAEEVPNRSDRQCKDHWNRVLSNRPQLQHIKAQEIAIKWRLENPKAAHASNYRRAPDNRPLSERPLVDGVPQILGAWSPEEDKLLLSGHAVHGPKWTIVATTIPGRDSKQCQKRFKRIMDARKLEEVKKKLEEQGLKDLALVNQVKGVLVWSGSAFTLQPLDEVGVNAEGAKNGEQSATEKDGDVKMSEIGSTSGMSVSSEHGTESKITAKSEEQLPETVVHMLSDQQPTAVSISNQQQPLETPLQISDQGPFKDTVMQLDEEQKTKSVLPVSNEKQFTETVLPETGQPTLNLIENATENGTMGPMEIESQIVQDVNIESNETQNTEI